LVESSRSGDDESTTTRVQEIRARWTYPFSIGCLASDSDLGSGSTYSIKSRLHNTRKLSTLGQLPPFREKYNRGHRATNKPSNRGHRATNKTNRKVSRATLL
jgi:hypothetical protein